MIKICIPTRSRSDVQPTLEMVKYMPFEKYLFVNPKCQNDDYMKYSDISNIVSFDAGNIADVRNFILDYFKVGDHILMLDDDIEFFCKLKNCKLIKMTQDEIVDFIKGAFNKCEYHGRKLWGVYPIENPFYMSNKITNGFIIGTCMGIVVNDLRFDVLSSLKEDYDYTVQNVAKFKGVIRYNNITMKAKHYDNKGGCNEYRSKERELAVAIYLKNKWPNIVKSNKRGEHEIILHL